MVVLFAEKNTPTSFGKGKEFKNLITCNRTNHTVKLDVFITDGDTLCIEVLKVD